MEEELGDLLFAAVKVGRFLGLDSELALHAACEKFIRQPSAGQKSWPAADDPDGAILFWSGSGQQAKQDSDSTSMT